MSNFILTGCKSQALPRTHHITCSLCKLPPRSSAHFMKTIFKKKSLTLHYSYERCKFVCRFHDVFAALKIRCEAELWQITLPQRRVSTHATVCYLAVVQVQHTRWREVSHCQVLHMYQPREGLPSPHLPWYWALNPFRRWLLSDVKCSRSQFLLLMTGDGRFMPVSLEWGKIAESNEQNRQQKSNAWKGNLCCKIIHACCKSSLEKGSMWVCFPKRPLRLW